MTVKKVEYCVSNIDAAGQQVCDLVHAEFPNVRVRRWACMGYCHRCIHVPFVLIDDMDYVEGDSVEELWESVKREIAAAAEEDTER